MPLKILATYTTCATSLDLLLQPQDETTINIYLKHLIHLKHKYICNIGVRARGARAPPALSALVGALGSAEEDLRRNDKCALAAMARSAACVMAMGDVGTARERAQVSGTGAWRGRLWDAG
jgi:hypothetical protein